MKIIGVVEPHAKWELIPAHCRESLEMYILYGVPVGHFLAAVLSNDLRRACERADDTNIKALPQYMRFLYSYAPVACWGSPAKYRAWLELGNKARSQGVPS